MGSPEAMIRATVNRLGARLGHGLADAFAELAVFAQDAPERIRQEWGLFQEEVMAEADRLERGDSDSFTVGTHENQSSAPTTDENPQDVIDRLRAKVAELSRELEGRS